MFAGVILTIARFPVSTPAGSRGRKKIPRIVLFTGRIT
jgi:hypothetical protein